MFIFYPMVVCMLVPFTILSWVLSPLLALLVREDGNLPEGLKWFQTFDAKVDTGWIDGYYKRPETPTQLWWARVKWLCRNPAYGFAYWALGADFYPEQWQVRSWRRGTNHVFFAWSDDLYFDLHFRLGWFAGKFGWKAFNMWDEPAGTWKVVRWGPDWVIPACFSPHLKFK